jgi:hypothetical protein
VAAFRIATSSRSRRFSARSRLISSFSSLVVPGRSPASTSAWATQRRNDSLPTPTCFETASNAADNVGYSPRCSITRRTARALSSGSIFFGMNCILPTQKDAASNLGRFKVPAEVDERGREGLARYMAELDLDLVCTSYLWDGAPGAWDGIDAHDLESGGDGTVVAFPTLVRGFEQIPGDVINAHAIPEA